MVDGREVGPIFQSDGLGRDSAMVAGAGQAEEAADDVANDRRPGFDPAAVLINARNSVNAVKNHANGLSGGFQFVIERC